MCRYLPILNTHIPATTIYTTPEVYCPDCLAAMLIDEAVFFARATVQD